MKRKLKKEIEKITEEFSGGAAQAAMDEAAAEWEAAFDTLVDSGESELEAYRQVLKDVEIMRSMLENMPETEEEQADEAERRTTHAWKKKVDAIHGSLEGLMWVATVILYFLLSFLFGHWHLTWLIFLSGAMGSILLAIVTSYLKGRPLRKQRGKWSGLMWLAITELYFLISFRFGHWYLTWLLFVCGAMIEILIELIWKWKE